MSNARSLSALLLYVCPTFSFCIAKISHFYRFCEYGEERANYPHSGVCGRSSDLKRPFPGLLWRDWRDRFLRASVY